MNLQQLETLDAAQVDAAQVNEARRTLLAEAAALLAYRWAQDLLAETRAAIAQVRSAIEAQAELDRSQARYDEVRAQAQAGARVDDEMAQVREH